MRPRKYPLASLLDLRQRTVERAAGGLASAVQLRQAAEAGVAAATARRDEAARAVVNTRRGEREALERGDLLASDLAHGDAWGVRVALEREALVAAVDGARESEASARKVEGQARAMVASSRAEARSVGQHQDRWEAAGRRQVEATEEEASAEAWRPRRQNET